MLRATLKSLLSRKLRLILSGLAVVLGVMFVSGAFVLTDTLGRSFDGCSPASSPTSTSRSPPRRPSPPTGRRRAGARQADAGRRWSTDPWRCPAVAERRPAPSTPTAPGSSAATARWSPASAPPRFGAELDRRGRLGSSCAHGREPPRRRRDRDQRRPGQGRRVSRRRPGRRPDPGAEARRSPWSASSATAAAGTRLGGSRRGRLHHAGGAAAHARRDGVYTHVDVQAADGVSADAAARRAVAAALGGGYEVKTGAAAGRRRVRRRRSRRDCPSSTTSCSASPGSPCSSASSSSSTRSRSSWRSGPGNWR